MITDSQVIELSKLEHRRKKLSDNPNTSRSRRRYAVRQKWLIEFKNKPCADCSNEYPWFCMDLDHREPDLKCRQRGNSLIKNISDALRRLPLRLFMEEVDKCDVVCANCHRLREFARGKYE